MSDKNRMPEVGDLIIQTFNNKDYCGTVYKIIRDKWGNGTAFLAWTEKPPHYVEHYGYSCANIHNIRGEFQVVKAKR